MSYITQDGSNMLKLIKQFRIHLILSMALVFFGQAVFAASSYTLPVTRDDGTKTRLSYDHWSGEYPKPVINVNAGKAGYTKISAYKSLRNLNQKVTCSIKNGLYHPWSKTSNSVMKYYTITAVEEYKALENAMLGQPIKKGTLISNVYYLSEGNCSGTIKSTKKALEFHCNILQVGPFKKISPHDNFSEQWLYVKCKEGYNAFVQDSGLLEQPDITIGEIKGYGSVSP